ncbi:MAG: hypothetical protein H7X89_06440 [Rhizobiales bacterium]|nr:hypothetical protein [Hyphomicrobiales bacterium]
MRQNFALVTVLTILLSACAAQLVEEDFAGPTAVVRDSHANFVKGNLIRADRVDFFILSRADGKQTGNALSATSMLNEGRGFSLKVQEFERRVPIKPMQAELLALTYHAAPISSLFNDTHEVKGTVRFEPQADQVYVVTGELRKGYSAVWIQTADGRVVTEKVEKRK